MAPPSTQSHRARRHAAGDEGDGASSIGPEYKTDRDLTDLGNPKGKSFEFKMKLADSERGLEYDTMSDRLARFINDEVLSAVLADPGVKAAYPQLGFTCARTMRRRRITTG